MLDITCCVRSLHAKLCHERDYTAPETSYPPTDMSGHKPHATMNGHHRCNRTASPPHRPNTLSPRPRLHRAAARNTAVHAAAGMPDEV